MFTSTNAFIPALQMQTQADAQPGPPASSQELPAPGALRPQSATFSQSQMPRLHPLPPGGTRLAQIRLPGGLTRVVTMGPNGELLGHAPPTSGTGGPPPPPYIPPPPPYPGAQMGPGGLQMGQKRPLLLQVICCVMLSCC